MDEKNLEAKYRPLSAWAYFGYEVLFAVPIVGFIFLIVYSFNDSNINRRNFARSFFCIYVVAVVLIIILAATGILSDLFAYQM